MLFRSQIAQPYINEALRDLPIAVVDHDGTLGSQELARRVDATSDVAITMALPDLATAQHEVFARGVTMFQIAIAIAAISALTRKQRFWIVSLLFGIAGCVFLTLGFVH